MGTANQIEQELMNYISDHKIRNTHSHHLPEQAMVDFDLDKLINNTYLQWQQVTPGTTAESRNAYLEKTRYKSYFVWLQKAIGELYGISEPITAQNWDQISDQIRKAHQNPDFYMDVLKNKCKYQKVIVDTYWNPGSDNGRPADFGRLGKCSGKYRLTGTDRSAQSIAKPPEKSVGNGIAEIRDKWKVVSVFGTAGRASDGYFIMVKER